MQVIVYRAWPGISALVVASVVSSLPLPAQGRVPPPPTRGPIAQTPALPPAPRPVGVAPVPGRGEGYTRHLGERVYGMRWLPAPYTVVETTPTSPSPTSPELAPYAVGTVRRLSPEPPPVPYDPRKASMRVVGGGADGGGGVMRISRVGTDSLRMVWIGEGRPNEQARLFLADGAYQELRSFTVSTTRREVVFRLSGQGAPVAYAGAAMVRADGSRKTVLVSMEEWR